MKKAKNLEAFFMYIESLIKRGPDENVCIEIFQYIHKVVSSLGKDDINEASRLDAWLRDTSHSLHNLSMDAYREIPAAFAKIRKVIEQEDAPTDSTLVKTIRNILCAPETAL